MNSLLGVTFLGFAAGIVGTGTGGAMVLVLRNPTDRLMSMILGLSSGFMISIVCFDLLPEAFEIGSLTVGIAGIVFGTAAIILIDRIVSSGIFINVQAVKNGYIRIGLLMGIGIAVHNFPEGLAIGSGLVAETRLGLSLAAVIAFHNIPEGMAMTAPMIAAGVPRGKILLAAMAAGVPMGIGSLAGHLLGAISAVLISFCLAFAGGAMLFITCGELIPKSYNIHRGRTSAFGIILGIIGGIMLTAGFS